jgi:hypothetical protein
MASINIDPSGLCIDLVCGIGETNITFTVEEIYEAWKDWMLLSDNAKYPQAMSSAGGDPLGGGEQLGAAVFLYTGNGWRICPDTTELEVRIKIVGNLFSNPAGDSIFAYGKVVASGHTHIEMRTSSLPVAIETGVSGLTTSESNLLTQAAELSKVIDGGMTAAQLIKLLAVTMAGKASGGGTGNITFRNLADNANAISMAVDTSGNRSSVTYNL